MQYRRLGKSSLVVSALGIGCLGMSPFYGTPDETEAVATLHRAIDRGITFLDVADVYGEGRSEELVGRTIEKRRHEAIIATKFGNTRQADGSMGISGRPEYVHRACEASLRRLRIPAIDLYYQHRVDPDVPIEDTIGAMARLVEQGKVRYLGMSEAGAKTIRRAHATHPITALQNEYALWTRDPEDEILEVCRELGIGFVAFSPLGRGFLTGSIKSADAFATGDFRAELPRFEDANLQKNLSILERIGQIAAEKRCTLAQLALAWVLAQGEDVVPIPGMERLAYLDENLGALNVELAPHELARLNEIAPRDIFAGPRYPEARLKRLGL